MKKCVNGLMQENTVCTEDRTIDPGSPGRPRARAVCAIVMLLFFVLLSRSTVLAQDGRGYFELSGGYKTGDFGTPTTSNLYYLSPVLGYVAPRYDVSVTMPYLFLSSGSGGSSMMNMQSGIGDIILRGGVVLVPEGPAGFSVDSSLGVKLPTADETMGLGTGETDHGAFLALHQRLDQFKLSLMGGYIKAGDPPQTNYNDVSLYGVGISRVFGGTNLSASFEGRRALIPGAKNPQEINVGFFHVLTEEYAVKGGTFVGLNDGGPDFGLNLGVVRWF